MLHWPEFFFSNLTVFKGVCLSQVFKPLRHTGAKKRQLYTPELTYNN